MATVILGAGAAGLGAGLTLASRGQPFRILERDDGPGGLGRTDDLDGFSFERTSHVLHFKRPHVEAAFGGRGVTLDRMERRAAVLVDGKQVPYPFQYNLWALDNPALARSAAAEIRSGGRGHDGDASSFLDVLLRAWGPTCVSLFFRPYNEKLWGRALEDLPPDCAGGYMPRCDVDLAERGAEHAVHFPGYNETFLYPSSGRLGDVMAALSSPVVDRISYGVEVTAVDLPARALQLSDGSAVRYEWLVSTIPLARLVEISGMTEAEPELFAATEIVNVRVGFRGKLRTPCHWIYVADPGLPFHRIAFPRNLSTATCPEGCASISVECTIRGGGPRPSSEEVATSALDYADRHELLDVEERVVLGETLISPAYVVRRSPGRPAFSALRSVLRDHGIVLAGRFGAWDYLSIEESFESGANAALACSPTTA
jgi:protoporphyrinogen oxidase